MSCIFTGAVAVFPSHSLSYKCDVHMVNGTCIFNLNINSPMKGHPRDFGAHVDFIVAINDDRDHYWPTTAPNIVIVDPTFVYCVSRKANETFNDGDEITSNVCMDEDDWDSVCRALGMRKNADDDWVFPPPKVVKPKEEVRDTHQSADVFIDEDPEPF